MVTASGRPSGIATTMIVTEMIMPSRTSSYHSIPSVGAAKARTTSAKKVRAAEPPPR